MATPPGKAEDGYEMQFGTNHMGHTLLTRLLPTLKYIATITPDMRVVFLSSSLHFTAPKEGYFLDNRLKTPMPDMSTWTLYGQSKLANIHYCGALAQRHPDIKFGSIHPGLVKTNLGTEFMSGSNFLVWAALKFAMRFTTVNVRESAFNSLWAVTNPAAESRVFYYPVGVTGKESKLAKDEK